MLNSLTISEMTARLAKRECTAREAMQACLDRKPQAYRGPKDYSRRRISCKADRCAVT